MRQKVERLPPLEERRARGAPPGAVDPNISPDVGDKNSPEQAVGKGDYVGMGGGGAQAPPAPGVAAAMALGGQSQGSDWDFDLPEDEAASPPQDALSGMAEAES